jgi:hypothetical protein
MEPQLRWKSRIADNAVYESNENNNIGYDVPIPG